MNVIGVTLQKLDVGVYCTFNPEIATVPPVDGWVILAMLSVSPISESVSLERIEIVNGVSSVLD